MRQLTELVATATMPLHLIRAHPFPDLYAETLLQRVAGLIDASNELDRFQFLDELQPYLQAQLTHFFTKAIVEHTAPALMDFMTVADAPEVIAVHQIKSGWHPVGPPNAHDADLKVFWTIHLHKAAHA